MEVDSFARSGSNGLPLPVGGGDLVDARGGEARREVYQPLTGRQRALNLAEQISMSDLEGCIDGKVTLLCRTVVWSAFVKGRGVVGGAPLMMAECVFSAVTVRVRTRQRRRSSVQACVDVDWALLRLGSLDSSYSGIIALMVGFDAFIECFGTGEEFGDFLCIRP